MQPSTTDYFTPSILLLLPLLVQLLQVSQVSAASSIFSPVALGISLSSERAALGGSVTVRCHVNPNSEKGLLMTKSSMTLYCPVTGDERTFCFQNCVAQATCNPETGECRSLPELVGVRCQSIQHASGELIYEYTVNDLTPEWFDWRRKGFACASAAETTEWRRLHQATNVEEIPSAMKPTTSPTTTTSTTSTTTTTPPPPPPPPPTTRATTTAAPGINTTSREDEGNRGWFNFLRTASQNNGSFWTAEMILLISLVALTLSLLINCFCCICWLVTRRHKKKSTSDDTTMHKPSTIQPYGWFPFDPRFSGHPSQQISPRTAYRLHVDPSGQSLSATSATDDAAPWMAGCSGVGVFDNGNQPVPSSAQIGQHPPRSHPESGKVGGSSGGCRSSDSGVSLSATAVVAAANSPLRYYPMGTPPRWPSPGSRRSRGKSNRFSSVEPPHQAYFASPAGQFYAACLEMPKRCSSRETVSSERALSETEVMAGGRYFYPLMLGGTGVVAETGSMRGIPSRTQLAAFGAPLWNPETSLIEEPGVGGGVMGGVGVADGASVVADDITAHNQEAEVANRRGADSGSTNSYSSSRPTPRNVYLRPYGSAVAAMPAMNAVPLVHSKTEPKLKSTSTSANNGVSVTIQNSAEVQKWLQSVPQGSTVKRDFQHRHPGSKHLADSLNTEYDVASDWSEKDPMLAKAVPSVTTTATGATDQTSNTS